MVDKWSAVSQRSIGGQSAVSRRSVHLDIDVDVANESQRSKESDGTQRQEEHVAAQQGVAEEFGGLQEAGHVGAFEVVEERVEEYEESR